MFNTYTDIIYFFKEHLTHPEITSDQLHIQRLKESTQLTTTKDLAGTIKYEQKLMLLIIGRDKDNKWSLYLI